MYIKCCCIICKKEFSIKGIHTHYQRTHGSIDEKNKYGSGYNHRYNDEKYKKAVNIGINARFDKKLGILKQFLVSCEKCKNKFYVIEREFSFPKKEKYFCSRSCANSRIITDDHRKKTSETLKKNSITQISCLYCDMLFIPSNKKRKYCSLHCSSIHRKNIKRKNILDFKNYRADCSFKFNLKDYAEEFDFSIIEKYGWYKPKNRGNNLDGVSRDHIISVKYGFDNKISPSIISHPANCQIMKHTENISKYTKNNLTIEELIQKIEIWNKKYNSNNP